jgi:PAS domain S-box-containing protein
MKIKVVLFISLINCITFFTSSLYSQYNISFEKISVEQGLSQSTVYLITQDKQGFIWIGTQDGLNKYDGYQFFIYQFDPNKTGTISSSSVSSLFKDSKNNLWAGTWGGGLNFYRPESNTFENFRNDPNKKESISSNRISFIHESARGEIWIGTAGGGLNKLLPGGKTFKIFNTANSKLSHNRIWGIAEDQKGFLWIGTENGLDRFNPATETFFNYKSVPNSNESLCFDRVRCVMVEKNGTVWAGTEKGLSKLNPAAGKFTNFHSAANNSKSISAEIINTIFEDAGGNIWIGTYDGGLNLFDRKTNTFYKYKNDPANESSISSNDVRSIFQDRSGNIWVGTRGGGINKFNLNYETFDHIKSSPFVSNSISNNNIRSIYEDKKGTLWIGTSEGGLNKIDGKTKNVTRYLAAGLNSISNNRVTAIHPDRNGILWIATDGGLNKFNPATGIFKYYKHDSKNPASISHDQLVSITEDNKGSLWIGSYGGGVNIFSPSTETFFSMKHDPTNPNSISGNEVLSLMADKSGLIWIGTSDGLNLFDPQTKLITRFKNEPGKSGIISNNTIWSLAETGKGVWIGTSYGLNYYDYTSKTFSCFTEKEGLPNNVVYGIVPDDSGNIWCSTNKGLSRYNPADKKFLNYNIYDGTQSNIFNLGAYHKGGSGKIYFGGINGITAFYPGRIKINPNKPKIVITGFHLFNRETEVSDSTYYLHQIVTTNRVTLTNSENFFTIEFAALDYLNPVKNQYMYKMEGVDVDWVKAGTKHYATYTNLDPDKYVFRVKASNNDGMWNEEGLTILITITPPFWQTWWFISLTVLFIGGMIWLFHTWRVNEFERREKELEGYIKQKEKIELELRIAQERYELAVKGSSDGIWDWNIRTNDVYLSTQWKHLLGYYDNELGNDISVFNNLLHYDDIDKIWEEINACLAGGEKFDTEVRLRKKEGTFGWFRLRGKAILGVDLKPTRMSGVMTDISERKAAQEKIIETQLRTQQILDNALDAVLTADQNGIITAWNNHAENIFGWSKEEAIGNKFSDMIVPEKHREAHLAGMNRLATTGESRILNKRIEITAIRKDGSEFPIEIAITQIASSEGNNFSAFIRDITERKIAQQKELENQLRMQQVLDNALDAVITTNKKGHITDINNQAEQIFGWTKEEARGKNIAELIVPQKYIEAHTAGMQRLENGEPSRMLNRRIEISAVRRNGEEFPVELAITQIEYSGEINFSAFIRDITERKKAEEQLRSNENLFKVITSGVSDLIVILDTQGKRIYTSDSYKKLFGSNVQLEGTDSFENIHPEDRERIQKIFNQTINSGDGQRLEYRFVLNDGTIRFIESQGNIIADEDGNPYRVVVVSRDITDYKTTEKELQESQQLLSSINQNINDAIYRSTPASGLVYVNEAFAKMFGHNSVEDALSTPSPFLYENPDDRLYLVNQIAKDGSFHNIEIKFKRKDGSSFWGLVSSKAIYDSGGEIVYYDGAISNITYLKQAEQEIRNLNKDLELKIKERTAELEETNSNLTQQISVREKIERVQNAIYMISESIHNSPDLQSLYSEIHKIIETLMPANNFYIALFDPTAEMMSFPYRVDEYNPVTKTRKSKKGLTEYVLRVGTPLLANLDMIKQLHQSGEVEQSGTPSPIWLGVPLIINQKALGVMAVQDYHNENAFGEDEKQILGYISEQVAIAIEKKRNEEAERKRVQLVLENRNSIMELAQLDKNDFDAALRKILSSASNALNVERVSFWSLDKEKQNLECQMLYLDSTNDVDLSSKSKILPATFPNQAGTYEHYLEKLKQNRPLITSNAQAGIESGIVEDYLVPLGITSMMDVPVWYHGDVVGIVCLEHVGPNRNFTLEEEDFATSIATMISLAFETSNRRIAEDNLRANEEQYRLVVDNANDAIIVAQDGMIKFSNPRAISITGFSAEELTTKPFTEFIHPEDRKTVVENYVKRMGGESVASSYPFRIVRKNGSIIMVEINAVLITWKGRPATLNFLTDVTERKRAEEEIKNALDKEKELSELRSRFISMASHEFRTPLTSILTSTEIIENYFAKLTEEQRSKNLTRIKENVKHMTHLLNDVLIIGKTEAGKLQLNLQLENLKTLCHTIVEQFEITIPSKTGHRLSFIENNLSENAMIDSKIIRQILENLISNAIKYSPDGGDVLFEAECRENEIFFKVRDQGIGIPDEDQKRLFEPFHRAKNVGTISGTGLGLAIMKTSVELHGGSIRVESSEGKGTTFTIEIPLIEK